MQGLGIYLLEMNVISSTQNKPVGYVIIFDAWIYLYDVASFSSDVQVVNCFSSQLRRSFDYSKGERPEI